MSLQGKTVKNAKMNSKRMGRVSIFVMAVVNWYTRISVAVTRQRFVKSKRMLLLKESWSCCLFCVLRPVIMCVSHETVREGGSSLTAWPTASVS